MQGGPERPLHDAGKRKPKLQWGPQKVDGSRAIEVLKKKKLQSAPRERFHVLWLGEGSRLNALGAQMSPSQAPDAGHVFPARSWPCYGLIFLCSAPIPLLSGKLYVIGN